MQQRGNQAGTEVVKALEERSKLNRFVELSPEETDVDATHHRTKQDPKGHDSIQQYRDQSYTHKKPVLASHQIPTGFHAANWFDSFALKICLGCGLHWMPECFLTRPTLETLQKIFQ
jgi:hypothetical protein